MKTKDELIEFSKGYWEERGRDLFDSSRSFNELLADFALVVSRAAWIPTSERLPEESGYYDIVRADNSITGEWVSIPGDIPSLRLAKAWRPIPAYEPDAREGE